MGTTWCPEVWFGAHPDGPTLLTGGQTLAEHIGEDPGRERSSAEACLRLGRPCCTWRKSSPLGADPEPQVHPRRRSRAKATALRRSWD